MAVGFRHADPRFPFFWETVSQPPARWHGGSEGPVQYLADTPDGAWAEFLRHEGITDPADLPGVRRRLWAVEVDLAREDQRVVAVDPTVAKGDLWSYPECQSAARQMRRDGATCLQASSAALQPGAARGQTCDSGLREAGGRNGVVWVLFGTRPAVRGWASVDVGAPTERVLGLVAHFGAARRAGSTNSNEPVSDP